MKKKILLLLTVLSGVLSAHATNGVTVGEVTISQGGNWHHQHRAEQR